MSKIGYALALAQRRVVASRVMGTFPVEVYVRSAEARDTAPVPIKCEGTAFTLVLFGGDDGRFPLAAV